MSSPLKNTGRILIILGILFIPAISYYLLSRGENQFKRLPIMGPRELPEPGSMDTVFHQVGEFTLLAHDSSAFSTSDLDDHITVMNFFFATCRTICPSMNSEMQKVQAKFSATDNIQLVSVTVDPEHDTVSALNHYAGSYDAIPGKWLFLTGDKKVIYDLARYGCYVTAMPGDGGPDDFIHSEKLILLDKQRRIRGYYNGTDPKDTERLIDEIKVLQWEYDESKPE
jgi:protein SCO1/2